MTLAPERPPDAHQGKSQTKGQLPSQIETCRRSSAPKVGHRLLLSCADTRRNSIFSEAPLLADQHVLSAAGWPAQTGSPSISATDNSSVGWAALYPLPTRACGRS